MPLQLPRGDSASSCQDDELTARCPRICAFDKSRVGLMLARVMAMLSLINAMGGPIPAS